ncbi:MAG: DUF6263 family protein [Phycisphaerae bacterium]
MKRLTIFAAAALLALSAGANAQEKVTLKQAWPEGTYVMTQTQDMAMTIPIGGAEQKTKTLSTIVAEIGAGKLTDAGQTLKMTFKRFTMNMNAGAMKMEYDSADPNTADNPMGKVFSAMLDKTIEVTMDAKGKVTKVTGVDKIFEGIADNTPQGQAMLKQMKQSFNDKMMAKMVEQGDFLPDKPVGKGDTFEKEVTQDMPMVGEARMKVDGKVKDIETTKDGTIATLDLACKLKSDKPAAAEGAMPGVRKMDMDMKGTSKFNATKGLPVSANMDMKGTIEVGAPAKDGEESPAMKITMEGVTRMELTSGKYAAPKIEKKPEPTAKPVEGF